MPVRNHCCSYLIVIAITAFLGFGAGPAAAQVAGHHHAPAGRTQAPVVDIVRDPADVPSPAGSRAPAVVRVTLTAREVVGHLDPAAGADYRYWTFDGKVPGPMIRVRQGDTVEVTLRNDPGSHMAHSVDFHAALGPGGGAAFSQAVPGQSKTFTFQASTPGLFLYHCGTPMIAEHIANGMYGLILVEPPGGLPPVDHEYYVVQGEIYTKSPKGAAGLQEYSAAKLMQEDPEYFVFNGAVDGLVKDHPLAAKVGETVRIFFGDAGPNRPSSLHIVGEIFTKDYALGSLSSPPLDGVQTAMVPPGAAAILEVKASMPGQFGLMDHAMARMAKGLMGVLDVTGPQSAALMHAGPAAGIQAASGSIIGVTPADAAVAGKGDMDPAFAMGTPSADTESTDPANGAAAHTMTMDHSASGTEAAKSPGGRHARRARVLPVSAAMATSRASAAPSQLDGCLTFLNDSFLLKIPDSGKLYRLEARPLLFAEHLDQLVHVAGHPGSVVAVQDPPGDQPPGFVVDTLDELAANCATPLASARSRFAAASRDAAVQAKAAVVVGMNDMAFLPAKVVIKAGQKVIWKDNSQVVHNVVADTSKAVTPTDVQYPAGARPFSSDFLQPGQTYAHVFTVPGVYRYVCTLHEGQGMKGVIVVK